MSFLSSVKRALGFEPAFDEEDLEEDEDLEEEDLYDDPETTDDTMDDNAADGQSAASGDSCAASEEELHSVTSDLFDTVLKYFNSQQPELVQRCIDLEVQRELILKDMDSNLRARLAALADQACRRGEKLWAQKQQKLGADLKKLKEEYNSVKQQRNEVQSLQLSATRQKRAFTDRIRDLENQVAQLEAEREQFQLENRSMASRLRAISNGAPSSASDDACEEIERLQNQNSELNESLKSVTDKLNSAKERIEHLNGVDSDNANLRKELSDTDATLTALQKRLAESAQNSEKQQAEIENLKSTIEKNINAYSETENELREEIKRLNALCSTIPPLAPVAPATSATPETAQAEVAPESASTHKHHGKKRRNKNKKQRSAETPVLINENEPPTVKISAIDELMDSTDWFVAPEPQPLKKDPEVEENFGYKEPPKKQEPNNDDRQLTLW